MFDRGLFAVVGSVLVGLMGACSPDTAPSGCPPPHPTFHLTIDCMEGPVPDDVTVSVVYGGGVEEFDAKSPADTPKSVFCTLHYDHPGDASAGAGGASISKVECELWTDGAATVTVKASGYPDLERSLSAQRDACGLVTTEAQMTLEHGD